MIRIIEIQTINNLRRKMMFAHNGFNHYIDRIQCVLRAIFTRMIIGFFYRKKPAIADAIL